MASFAEQPTGTPGPGGSLRKILRERFDQYCVFGCTSPSIIGLTSKNFVKMARDSGLIDNKRLTSTQLDLIYTRCSERGAKRMKWDQFLRALSECAVVRGSPVNEVYATVGNDGYGPTLNSSVHPERIRFHDDKSLYTGVHRVGGPAPIDKVASLEALLDRSEANIRGVKEAAVYGGESAGMSAIVYGGGEPARTRSNSTPNRTKHSPTRSLERRLSSPKTAQRVQDYHPHQPPNFYDILTRYFMRHNPAKVANVGLLLAQYSGREIDLFDKIADKYGEPVLDSYDEEKAQPTIYDKLTDPTLYTGSHKLRFDQAGKGRGLAGRDSVSKGGGFSKSPVAFNGNTNQNTDTIFFDSSQFLMR